MRVEIGKAEAWHELWSNRVADLRGTPAADVALAQGFAATTAQLRDLGLHHNDLRRMVRRGEWSRPDRGVLSPVVVQDDGFDGERQAHALRSTAAALLRPNHVITGRSAAVVNGLPVLALPAEPVLTSRDDDSRGRRSGVHVRTAALPPSAGVGVRCTRHDRLAVRCRPGATEPVRRHHGGRCRAARVADDDPGAPGGTGPRRRLARRPASS